MSRADKLIEKLAEAATEIGRLQQINDTLQNRLRTENLLAASDRETIRNLKLQIEKMEQAHAKAKASGAHAREQAARITQAHAALLDQINRASDEAAEALDKPF